MIITLDEIYTVFPKHDIERLFNGKVNKSPRNKIYKRLVESVNRQEGVVREYLGKIANWDEGVPETVKWCISARVAWELCFHGDLPEIKEKYKLLLDEAAKMLKAYKDGTISRNETNLTVRISRRRNTQRFNWG